MHATFHSAIHCYILLNFSFVHLVFIGTNDPNRKAKADLKQNHGGNYFVIEHVQSSEEEHASEDQPLSAKCSPPLATSCAGEYIVWCCVCVHFCVFPPCQI
jgi:hypothetical protein